MHFETLGRTDAGAETLLVSAGLGGSESFWRPQIDALAATFRIVTYDHRGTGKNAAALPADYAIGMMADDVIEILDAAKIERCHFLGHALGGLVGLDLALRYPNRIGRLVVVNAWAKPNSHTQRCFAVRRDLLINSGVAAYVRAQPIFLYPAAWLEKNAVQIAREEAHGILNFQGEGNILKRIDALLAFDVESRLCEISAPTLVVASRDDVLVPWTCSQVLAGGIRNSKIRVIPEGGHGFTAIDPEVFNSELIDFLNA